MYHFCNISEFRKNILITVLLGLLSSGAVYAQDANATSENSEVEGQSETQEPVVLTFEEEVALLIQTGFEEKGLDEFAAFYETRDYAPIWADSDDDIRNLLLAFNHAPVHGMPLARYQSGEIIDAWMMEKSAAQVASLEVASAISYVTFAKDMTSGFLNPNTIHREINVTRHIPETADVLSAVASAGDMPAHYIQLQPSHPDYAHLLELKAELEEMVGGAKDAHIVPAGRTLRPGHSNERVIALRWRLIELGYVVTDLDSEEYDDSLVAVVKDFQKDSGLNADGLAGPQTLNALNSGPEDRLKQVIVNLERVRWMNYALGDRHIYVNIPNFQASVVDNGVPSHTFRVVVGTGANQTAEFSDQMTHMIANPTWHVPTSIASKEYLPRLQQDPTVLQRSGIQMLVRGTGEVVDSTTVDYSTYTTSDFPFVLQQRPGNYNALGRVKFMFPNKYNIYLHDTPSKSLFSRDARAFSHGCIRVQDPFDLAYKLLELQEADPVAKFHQVLDTRRETQIDLANPIPVHIVYRTVWLGEDGTTQYRPDVYFRDKYVFDAMAKLGVTLPGDEG